MDTPSIAQRIRLGEDSETELKSVAHSGFELTPQLQQGVAKEVVAFANSGGGWLILGAEDDGTPTGVGTPQQADNILRQVTQICQTQVHPALFCRTTKAEVSGKLLLVVEVPAWSSNRPHRTGSKFYVRDGAMAREATQEELVRIITSQAVHFDEQPARGATREDLDDAAIAHFLKRVYPTEAVRDASTYLRALKCLDGDQPTITGILFFGRDPQRFFPDARVSAVRFPGERYASSMDDRKDFGGSIFQQIESAERFLADHVPSPSRVEGWKRVETGVPVPVLREALHNALAHRDYNAASQTRLFVFSDRVEVVNPGILLNRLTPESIQLGGISQRRNPTIAALIVRALGRENLGMGVPRMFEEMRDAGLPDPEIDLAGGHFKLVLRTKPVGGAA